MRRIMNKFKFTEMLIKEAGLMLTDFYLEERKISEKKDEFDLVTQFDLKLQEFLIQKIKKEFPQDSIFAEENGMDKIKEWKNKNLWIIDPIDGTVNFIHRIPFFAISLAYYENGEPVFGFVLNPITRELFYAQREQGAYLNEKRIKVSENSELKKSIIMFGISNFDKLNLLNKFNRKVRRMRLFGAAALHSSYVASGYCDAFIVKDIHPWDIAAGYLILKEAGGKITDWSGREITSFQTEQMIFSNGKVTQEIINIINE